MNIPEVTEMPQNQAKKTTKLPKGAIIAICGCAAIVVGIASFAIYKKYKQPEQVFAFGPTDMVSVGIVEETLTGMAVTEPYAKHEIKSSVGGNIIRAPFEAGDVVVQGDVLYEFDKSAANQSVQTQEVGMEQSKMSYEDAVKEAEKLAIKAPASGVVSGVTAKVGEVILKSTALAAVEDTHNLEAVLKFNSSQIGQIAVGDQAVISSPDHGGSIAGTVSQISRNAMIMGNGSKLYDVTIKLENPGDLKLESKVTAMIKGMASHGTGSLNGTDKQSVIAEIDGEITNIYYKDGDYVNKGDLMFTLKNDSVVENIKNSDMQYRSSTASLQESKDNVEEHSLTSPINGMVIEKNNKVGDVIDASLNTQPLMVVADISRLKCMLPISEKDVSKVQVGQAVKITCDALKDEEHIGVITGVTVGGTVNGATVYSAEVVVNEPGNLRPNMNVKTTIVFASSEKNLRVPTGDIEVLMGKSFVFRKVSEMIPADKADTEEKPRIRELDKVEEDMPVLGIERDDKDMPETDDKSGEEQTEAQVKEDRFPEVPDGFEMVEVITGLSNPEYTEILAGLKAGDEIYRNRLKASSDAIVISGMSAMYGDALNSLSEEK